jgi:hypothetical protein
MTAKQRANRERFKKVVSEAKKLRQKNPKLTQAQAVKQAWAISYTKQRAGKKLTGNPRRETQHKDIKSHNVNIRVMSGIGTGLDNKNDIVTIYRGYPPHRSSAAHNGKKIPLKKAYNLIKKDNYKYWYQVEWSWGLDIIYKK